ncbi:MAG: hypothetical protein AAF752_16730 [Bacteroidota bacterium]
MRLVFVFRLLIGFFLVGLAVPDVHAQSTPFRVEVSTVYAGVVKHPNHLKSGYIRFDRFTQWYGPGVEIRLRGELSSYVSAAIAYSWFVPEQPANIGSNLTLNYEEASVWQLVISVRGTFLKPSKRLRLYAEAGWAPTRAEFTSSGRFGTSERSGHTVFRVGIEGRLSDRIALSLGAELTRGPYAHICTFIREDFCPYLQSRTGTARSVRAGVSVGI